MCGCRQFIQTKTGQDLPKENMESALEELVTTYKTELGLSDKEADQLQHLQVSHNSSNRPRAASGYKGCHYGATWPTPFFCSGKFA